MPVLTTDFVRPAEALQLSSATVTGFSYYYRKPPGLVVGIPVGEHPVYDGRLDANPYYTANINIMHGNQRGESILWPENKNTGINARFIQVLENFRLLGDNWDENDAVAPKKNNLEDAIRFVKYLQAIGENVFQVAPGPSGEIMIELRNKEKSIEFLFYPNKTKVVDFTEPSKPKQGPYTQESLQTLLTSLNAKPGRSS